MSEQSPPKHTLADWCQAARWWSKAECCYWTPSLGILIINIQSRSCVVQWWRDSLTASLPEWHLKCRNRDYAQLLVLLHWYCCELTYPSELNYSIWCCEFPLTYLLHFGSCTLTRQCHTMKVQHLTRHKLYLGIEKSAILDLTIHFQRSHICYQWRPAYSIVLYIVGADRQLHGLWYVGYVG